MNTGELSLTSDKLISTCIDVFLTSDKPPSVAIIKKLYFS